MIPCRTAHFVCPSHFSPCFPRLSQTVKTPCKVSRGFMAEHSQIPMCSGWKIVRFTTLYRCLLEQLASRWVMTENDSENLRYQCSEYFTHEKKNCWLLYSVFIMLALLLWYYYSLAINYTEHKTCQLGRKQLGKHFEQRGNGYNSRWLLRFYSLTLGFNS